MPSHVCVECALWRIVSQHSYFCWVCAHTYSISKTMLHAMRSSRRIIMENYVRHASVYSLKMRCMHLLYAHLSRKDGSPLRGSRSRSSFTVLCTRVQLFENTLTHRRASIRVCACVVFTHTVEWYSHRCFF